MTDGRHENEKASLAGLASSENNFGADSTVKPGKPELDLKSWVALGANVKPARLDRRQKRTWNKRGAI
jgi:hypothetical protein